MNKIIYTLSFLAFGLGLGSCSQAYTDVDGATKNGFYDSPRQVYFELRTGDSQTISNFAYGKADYTTFGMVVESGTLTSDSTLVRLDIPVLLSGPTSSDSLTFAVRIGTPIDYAGITGNADNSPLPAISGTDFEPLASTYKFAPGQVRTTIPVYFKRSAIQQAEERGKELILELASGGDFQQRFTANTAYRIQISDDLTQPNWWYYFYGPNKILGDFTKEKYRIVLSRLDPVFLAEFNSGNNFYGPRYYSVVATLALELRSEYPALGFGEEAEKYIP